MGPRLRGSCAARGAPTGLARSASPGAPPAALRRACAGLCAALACSALLLLPAAAREVTVGTGSLRWDFAVQDTWLVSVRRDSIWMWDVQANANVARGTAARGGATLHAVAGPLGGSWQPLAEADALYDGDAGTAFDPDATPGVERTTPLLISLGGAFRVNHVRLYPRLDHANRFRYPQAFTLFGGLEMPSAGSDPMLALPSQLLAYSSDNPNVEPVLDEVIPTQDVAYMLLVPAVNRPWEIAELEVYSDGSVPVGRFTSKVLPALGLRPVWGRVRYEGGSITDLPVVVRTRTGTEPDPLIYFIKVGDGEAQVTAQEWTDADDEAKLPPRDNPAWSPWEPLDEGVIRSPAGRSYLQFEVDMGEPGTVLRRLIFEYVSPPIAKDLLAELSPITVVGGEETRFTLSLEVHLQSSWVSGSSDTGFRQLDVRTPMEIRRIDRVRVDDQNAPYTASVEPGSGFTVNLWQRVVQDGTFVQIDFRGAAYRDGTRVEVQAVDRRREDNATQTVYQLAREADVDPGTPGGTLVVRLQGAQEGVPLVSGLTCQRLITPNGDGVGDALRLSYALLKLVQPVPVSLTIRDLAGRLVAQPCQELQTLGQRVCQWDGRDAAGQRVPPGAYVYELRVGTGAQAERHSGLVGVAY